jgi:hypothetical protein
VLVFPLVGFAVAGSDAGPVDEARLDLSDPARDFR